MMPRRAVVDAAACAIIIGVLAIIGAVGVVYEVIRFIMPVLVFIDFVGR
jgi:hypothetical protein